MEFLSVFNGKTFFVESEPVALEEFSTDACPIGGGGFFRGDWFYINWEVDHPDLAKAHINLKETFTVLVALERWKHQLRDKWIVVRSDNHTTISALNKGTCPNPQIMQWFREIFWLSATHNFRATTRYIPSKSNTMADAISCLHEPRYCQVLTEHFGSSLAKQDCCGPHLSQTALFSFPLQVQSTLKRSNFKTNRESIVFTLSRNPQPLHISRSYERIFDSVFTSATLQFHAAPYTFSDMLSFFPEHCPLPASLTILMSSDSCTCSRIILTLLNSLYSSIKKPCS